MFTSRKNRTKYNLVQVNHIKIQKLSFKINLKTG